VLPELYPHQDNALLKADPKLAIFWSPRLGKSRYAAEWLRHLWAKEYIFADANGLSVVIAPLNVCPQWMDVLQAAMPYLPLKAGYGLSGASLRSWLSTKPRGVLVLSDSLLGPCIEALLKCRPEALVVDESHRFIGAGTKRGRAMRRLAWKTPYVRLLTGTPAPNHEGNLWGQMAAIDPDKWEKSYTRFAKKHLIRDSMFPSKVYGVQRPLELQAMLNASADIVRREDVFGPDTWQEIVREVDLDPKTMRLYKQLAKDKILEAPDLTAENAGVLLVRLSQITAGILPSDDGEEQDLPSPKLNACIADLEEIVEEGGKAIIYYKFQREGERAETAIAKAFPNAEVLRLGGDTSINDREYIYEAVEAADHPVIAVVQIQAGGIGRSFAEAQYEGFLTEGPSFSEVEQAKDRIYKRGARRVVTRYRCRNTVDTGIFGAIQDYKETLHDRIRTSDRAEWVGF
jgi:hypothetical protein